MRKTTLKPKLNELDTANCLVASAGEVLETGARRNVEQRTHVAPVSVE
jgi:hypothetical protein